MAASLAALEGFIVDIVPSSRAGKNGAESLIRCQLVEQLFQFMKKGKMIEVVYCSTVKWSPYL
jgi:hypothetical protein